MRRFTENVKPRVKIANVDETAEKEAKERARFETQSMIADKQYIKQNVQRVREIETQVKVAKEATIKRLEEITSKVSQTPKGAIPKYLAQKKK
jgi:hypothetical protein